ncbi:hypothetical protein V5E97_04740 [Singulisphaera sp. Ch08]|uniref:DUF5666 domain-containing protein n=1 Tax=Singulisphaera sp. Ch08 TaxID=3120278 RepID=A0AAU7CJW4_9BACT
MKASRNRPGCALIEFLVVVALIGAFPTRNSAGSDESAEKVIPAVEAHDHVDETVTVAMTVRASKDAAPRREIYLDSEEDFRDEKNVAVVLSYDQLDAFKRAGIDDPAEHYRGKSIRVTGKLIREADQVRIRVAEPSQIKLTENDK